MSEAARELLPENEALETPKPIEEAPLTSEEDAKPASELPLHWHGFLIRFYLPLAAAYHLFQVVWICSGKIYYEITVRDAVYAGLPAMQIADYCFAAMLLCSSLLFIAAAIGLNQRRRAGIKRLIAAYIVLVLSAGGYALSRLLISELPASAVLIAQSIAYLLLLLMNTFYYRKRSNIFGQS